jgi:hypothetical protein
MQPIMSVLYMLLLTLHVSGPYKNISIHVDHLPVSLIQFPHLSILSVHDSYQIKWYVTNYDVHPP